VSAGDYTIDVVIGAWSATIDRGDPTAPAADAVTMDPLSASWSLNGGFPSQPTPTTCSFGLYVPDVANGPTPAQGTRVEITITTPDHDPLATEIPPVFEFVGLITDVEAATHDDGLAFSIIATDYTSTLGEEHVGDVPWPDESRYARLQRMIAASGLPITIPPIQSDTVIPGIVNEFDLVGFGPGVAARDVDSQPTRALLDDLLAGGAFWMGRDPVAAITGRGIDNTVRAPELATWARPIISQSVDGAGAVTFPVCLIVGGLPDLDGAIPYTVALNGGTLELVRKPSPPASSMVAWIPASAIDSDSIKWRQDKASNTNRARATAPEILFNLQPVGGSAVVEHADLVASNGPNEITIQLDGSPDLTPVVGLLDALIGTYYDASPRWTFESITVYADAIADGDQWPRLFDPRERAHVYDRAAGKFILLTDPAPKWNLHDRLDYFGRLAGATLTLSGGRIVWTANLAHRLPMGAGVQTAYQVYPLNVDPTPTHHAITYAELAAGANPTVNQCGDLTPADMQLVEG
jgi:hypothetical protein